MISASDNWWKPSVIRPSGNLRRFLSWKTTHKTAPIMWMRNRTTAYIASPWIERGAIDHRFNNTDTLLKTMELLLGLQPMSQFDAMALPIMDWNNSPDNSEPFTAILPSKDIIAQVNPPRKEKETAKAGTIDSLVAASDQMDFIHPDSAPADVLNQIIWKSVKGVDSPMPAPRNSLVSPARSGIAPAKKDDDDDD